MKSYSKRVIQELKRDTGRDKYNRQAIMHSGLSFMTSSNRDDKEQCREEPIKDSLHNLLYILKL